MNEQSVKESLVAQNGAAAVAAMAAAIEGPQPCAPARQAPRHTDPEHVYRKRKEKRKASKAARKRNR